jgi:hypothetical protein
LKTIFGEVFYVVTAPVVWITAGTVVGGTVGRVGRSPGLLLHAVDEAGEFEGAVARIKLVETLQLAPSLLLP